VLRQALTQFLDCGPVGDPAQLGEQIIGKGHACERRARLEPAMQSIGNIPDLDHHGHVTNIETCVSHVKGRRRQRPYLREVETFGAPFIDPNANRDMFEKGVEVLFKAFAGKPFSHKGKYYTIPPEVPYRGYTLKEITLVRRRSGCRSNAGSQSRAAPSAPSTSRRDTASAAARPPRVAASTTRHCHNRSVTSRASMPASGRAFAIEGVANA